MLCGHGASSRLPSWVCFFSAAVAIFSPPLGLGLFFMYFALRHEAVTNSIIQRMVKRNFEQM